jgi:methylated-DNA-[protein]-cysteine S-methyltransferase
MSFQSQHFSYLSTPIGILNIEANDSKVTAITFLFEKATKKENPNWLSEEAAFQLKAYFAEKLTKFDLPLRQDGTEFQNKVWKELMEIPFGKTITYGQLATKLGDPSYVRAVGAANGKNPLAIVVPCHRVIGANGSLVGYAGGLQRKKWLLNFESQLSSGQLEMF